MRDDDESARCLTLSISITGTNIIHATNINIYENQARNCIIIQSYSNVVSLYRQWKNSSNSYHIPTLLYCFSYLFIFFEVDGVMLLAPNIMNGTLISFSFINAPPNEAQIIIWTQGARELRSSARSLLPITCAHSKRCM